jgi:hypothetical protein
MVDIETPSGERLPIDDPRLIDMLREGIRDTYELTLLRSDRAMTDCRPVSIISIQTARRVSEGVGELIWTSGASGANVYMELESGNAFGETILLAGHCGLRKDSDRSD